MSFGTKLMPLRDKARGLILPVNKLTAQIKAVENPSVILDFGAGTLFWTKKFAEIFHDSKIIAVDMFYENSMDSLPKLDGVQYFSKISDVPSGESFSLAWFCDVLHHISEEEQTDILTQIAAQSDCVIVKDIDCRHKFGNFMNRCHDRYLNGEKIRDISPPHISELLEKTGFSVEYHYMPKLWYPHFALIAKKGE